MGQKIIELALQINRGKLIAIFFVLANTLILCKSEQSIKQKAYVDNFSISGLKTDVKINFSIRINFDSIFIPFSINNSKRLEFYSAELQRKDFNTHTLYSLDLTVLKDIILKALEDEKNNNFFVFIIISSWVLS